MPKLKIKKGDHVVVITGKDKGKKGEVLKVIPAENRAMVKGVAMIRRHQQQTAAQEGGIICQGGGDPHLQSRDRGPQGREADAGRVQIFEGRAQGSLCQALGRSHRWLSRPTFRGSSSTTTT